MKLLVVLALVSVASAVPVLNMARGAARGASAEEENLFLAFKAQHGKVYFDSHDESFRKAVFVQNLNKIAVHNAQAEAGKHTYTLAMNEFGDLTWEEFHAKYTGFKGNQRQYIRSQNTEDLSHVEVQDSVDWVAKGAVTAVKNQGQCGSCWAFSSTGGVEGAWFLSKGQLVSLSEQQLMDCSKEEGNMSCNGGLMDDAFEYYINKKGACTEDSYPYLERDEDTCKACDVVATISSYKDVDHSEKALEQAVSQQPVSVAIEADQESFQFYSSGVMTGECGTSLDHGVLAVGYGTMDGTEYWKVKNSWGATWGMDGYILLQKGKDQSGGQCGILLSASYPVV